MRGVQGEPRSAPTALPPLCCGHAVRLGAKRLDAGALHGYVGDGKTHTLLFGSGAALLTVARRIKLDHPDVGSVTSRIGWPMSSRA